MDWTFNFRTPCYSDDEDSSSEAEQTAISDYSSSLLTELDLSSRHDDACHKPNPWTIAKVNSTTRKPSLSNRDTKGTNNGRKRMTSPQKLTTSHKKALGSRTKWKSDTKGPTDTFAVCPFPHNHFSTALSSSVARTGEQRGQGY